MEPEWVFNPPTSKSADEGLLPTRERTAAMDTILIDQLETLKHKLAQMEQQINSNQTGSLHQPPTISPETKSAFADDDDEFIMFKGLEYLHQSDPRVCHANELFTPRSIMLKDPLMKFLKENVKVQEFRRHAQGRNDFLHCSSPWYSGSRNSKLDDKFEEKVLRRLPHKMVKEPVMTKNGPFSTSESREINGSVLEEALPSKKSVWLLIDRFFEFWHPLYPFLDQKEFTESLVDLIGERTSEDVQINIYGIYRSRLVFLSLVLYLIYLGQLTLYNITMEPIPESKTNEDLAFLVSHPLHEKLLKVALNCGYWGNISDIPTLLTVQNLLYSRIAFKHSPEEGDHTDIDALIGLLLRSSQTIGLNRDPCILGSGDDLKRINLWRKLWYGVMCVDYGWGFTNDALGPRISQYNTKLPVFLGATNANVSELENERASIALINCRTEFNKKFANLSTLIMNIDGKVKVSQILDALNDIADLQEQLTGDIDDFLKPGSLCSKDKFYRVRKISGLCSYLEVQTLSSLMNYHIFLFYEEKGQVEKAKRLLLKSLSQVINIHRLVGAIVFDLSSYFGSGNDHILASTLIESTGRTRCIVFATLVRVHHVSYNRFLRAQLDPDTEKLLEELLETGNKVVVSGFRFQGRLSASHFNAWFFCKVHTFAYRKIMPLILEDIFNRAKEPKMDMHKLDYNSMLKWNTADFRCIIDTMMNKNDSTPHTSVSTKVSPDTDSSINGHQVIDSGWIGKLINNKWYPYMDGNVFTQDNDQSMKTEQTPLLTGTELNPLGDFPNTDGNLDQFFTSIDSPFWNAFSL
ncbi:hypothetical protein OGAPHI_005895 [Ogataea philodendri]|uniref:Xylanolytic transcriptional activator regulatory domain-containing protein n=1 Tax=Ogataea philodendri TaxID=1378263 RepID=A0A9P8NYC1_9ASCO|nr:uncharacterized protein OGAPHI_005895 [Ogataea philodendri]KAH3661717.1 hypothetical protein OGAPHI_005895 [Ogataea philodendri]